MNVIKLFLILSISLSLLAKENIDKSKPKKLKYSDFYESNFEIEAIFDLRYSKDTVIEHDFDPNFLLGFHYYLDNKIFLSTALNLSFSEKEDYGTMVKLDKSKFEIYFGGGYRFFHKRKHFFTGLGGFKIQYETQKRTFTEGSPDIDTKYEGNERSFFDYAPYLGIGWHYIFFKSKVLKDNFVPKKHNLMSFKMELLYERIINLAENSYHIRFSSSYIF